ncbi:hypothetical protein KDC22_13835 [Paenibacillus tritici]|uniref:hypothetical protein n=1 Tax=Paenibacillus tritici TaxID=1873425 RepID=UPI001BAD3743|nr:hypothetical protein [Paenibacillus tritici]QUL57453.1 hypothetical protein KDC22_13835 [Paenibacillus tritici]
MSCLDHRGSYIIHPQGDYVQCLLSVKGPRTKQVYLYKKHYRTKQKAKEAEGKFGTVGAVATARKLSEGKLPRKDKLSPDFTRLQRFKNQEIWDNSGRKSKCSPQ